MKSFAIIVYLTALAAALEDQDWTDLIKFYPTDGDAIAYIKSQWTGTLKTEAGNGSVSMVNELSSTVKFKDAFASGDYVETYLCFGNDCTLWSLSSKTGTIYTCTKPEAGFKPVTEAQTETFLTQCTATSKIMSTWIDSTGSGEFAKTDEEDCKAQNDKTCSINSLDIKGRQIKISSQYIEQDQEFTEAQIQQFGEKTVLTLLQGEIDTKTTELVEQRKIATAGVMYILNQDADRSDMPKEEEETFFDETTDDSEANKTKDDTTNTTEEPSTTGVKITEGTDKLDVEDDSATTAFAYIGAISIATTALAF